ncbi:hypothetical protein QGX17_gp078 [Pseudomonas phage phiPsa381]|uniref:Uncharacterized protein n=2 Tax=Otagovirus TaxID=2560197 RepID=A0A7G9V2R3_9CAUD|nr:hypothetical protein QGX16_gp077 [Pseudomonas phage phiPsa397]YP_010767409.1 hypothetical protein QGX17_gp078 [Pseudomonas phage phiPsa381]QNO00569.1 hypothetical protein phiPsa381_146 [Pseudomonas phage phiPsa381]QNO00743.1 hypothetical protein phiPsa397_148 [Pseudomonas phage phiPsa397]
MLLIGSRALVANNPELEGVRRTIDWDFICTIEQFTAWHKANKANLQFAVPTQQGKYYHARDKDGMNYEFELAWEGTSALLLLQQYGLHNHVWKPEIGPVPAINDDLYMIKMCHRYKRNSPHFLKTMSDIKFLREKCGPDVDKWLSVVSVNQSIIKLREAESYDYAHPRLNVTSKDFFNGDGVNYVYDHDSIHLAVALTRPNEHTFQPAYTFYMKDGSEVMTSKEKFMSVPERIRLYGVYEESCVLALERSQIPHGLGKEGGPSARWSFEMALMKVCTSITSGWFREYAWENYQKVLDLYNELGENDYIERFNRNQHLLKPYTGENY